MKSIVEKARKIVTQLYERNMVSWNDLDREVVFAIQALNAEVQRMEALAQPEQCQCPNCKVTLHASDCAVHNEPAYPKGACNCGARQEQEPVAWMSKDADIVYTSIEVDGYFQHDHIPLYTTPPQRKPLTDEQIEEIAEGYLVDYRIPAGCAWNFARDIEAAHGIKEKNT